MSRKGRNVALLSCAPSWIPETLLTLRKLLTVSRSTAHSPLSGIRLSTNSTRITAATERRYAATNGPASSSSIQTKYSLDKLHVAVSRIVPPSPHLLLRVRSKPFVLPESNRKTTMWRIDPDQNGNQGSSLFFSLGLSAALSCYLLLQLRFEGCTCWCPDCTPTVQCLWKYMYVYLGSITLPQASFYAMVLL